METVSLKIDGRDITVAKGKTILEAALDNGISIPFYCYHPGIGVEGSCRVCIVKVEKMPKLQTSCSTVCTDGMVVATSTPEVVQARASVFEFLLINHPLDCPVCDKGGECPLQDYSYAFGPAGSRMEFPRRTFDGEGVSADVDFGPTLMLNRNRCIMCTRCVRFMKEIDADAQIGIVDRGGHSQIATFGERGVHSLISGNLMDVCPVGAITTRDYRFKSRPWDNPLAVDTTCTLCSKGCSTTAWLKAMPEWAKGARLIRFTPRYNPDINGYWMCDIGRFQYHWVEGDARLTTPLLRQGSGAQAKSTWGGALATVRERLLPVAKEQAAGFRMLVSAHASHEELYLVRQLVGQMPGSNVESAVAVSWRLSAKVQPKGTKFTVPPADAPNVAGARAMGFRVPEGADAACDIGALRKEVASGAVKALYVIDPGPEGSIGDVQWVIDARANGTLPLLIVQGVQMTPLAAAADIVLPGSAWVEKEATYTNDLGLLQATARVMAPPGDAHEDWRVIADVATAAGITTSYADAQAVRAAIAAAMGGEPAFAGIAGVAFPKPQAAKTWLQASNPSERWKWDHMFQDLPPVKGFPLLLRERE
ncbi:MAG: molybdopterin-dependent oxidoreductase [Vicinamibacterales bacterium]|jgi:NADH-quinone oxidoreductase subunit G|nr:molybdopterin-dependent oxidoreductase [Vicinamibacterales bacterium]